MYIIMSNPWITHLKKFQKQNPSLSYKECMVKGKKSYTKKQKGNGLFSKRTAVVVPVDHAVGDTERRKSIAASGLMNGTPILHTTPDIYATSNVPKYVRDRLKKSGLLD